MQTSVVKLRKNLHEWINKAHRNPVRVQKYDVTVGYLINPQDFQFLNQVANRFYEKLARENRKQKFTNHESFYSAQNIDMGERKDQIKAYFDKIEDTGKTNAKAVNLEGTIWSKNFQEFVLLFMRAEGKFLVVGIIDKPTD
jgi:hypothetical protein